MIHISEKIILDMQQGAWTALSLHGSGILAKVLLGKHDEDLMETRGIALAFASQVLHVIGLAHPSQERIPTSQVLVDVADAVIGQMELVEIICTTWQILPGGIEICSIGSNSVLAFEENTIRKVIAPHNINELLRSSGTQNQHAFVRGGIPTHVLGSRINHKRCHVKDVKMSFVPLLPTTTIAVIAHWQLAEAILEQAVPEKELLSFIETWDHLAKKVRTSVLISLP